MVKDILSYTPSQEELTHIGAVLPIWKKKGESTHQIAVQVAQKWQVKCAHTGILDPLAEGVIVLLLGQARFDRAYYTQLKKYYRTEVCLGLHTDSLDLLGLMSPPQATNHYPLAKLYDLLSQSKDQYIGYVQQVPPYISSVKIDGKRSQYWVKHHNKAKKLPARTVHISQLELIKVQSMPYQSIRDKAYEEIPITQGILRQEQCLLSWQAHHSLYSDDHLLSGFVFDATVGSGCYIRSIARDWLSNCGINHGIVTQLTRLSNAGFTYDDCGRMFGPRMLR